MLHFLGIGAQKAGTTWLYEQLKHHPHLAFPLGKEVHFWDRPHTASDVDDYLRKLAVPRKRNGFFSAWTEYLFHPSLFRKFELLAGEITPSYGILPRETIQEIYHYAPQVRLIYLIRNPIERAWSSAQMALQRAEMTIDEASDQWFIDHFCSSGSLRRGDYYTCLCNWHSVFPNEQLLVLRFEELVTEPEALLNRCFAHLGVALQTAEHLQKWGCRTPVFAGPGHPLRPTLKPILRNLYQRPIERLAEYLHTDLSAWLDC